MTRDWKSIILVGLFLLGGLSVIILSLNFANGNFRLSPKAYAGPNPASLVQRLPVGLTQTTTIGTTLPVSLYVQIPKWYGDKGITGIKATLTFTNPSPAPFQITDSDIIKTLPADQWMYAFRTVTTNGNQTTLNIEAIYFGENADLVNGYMLANELEFAKINLRAVAAGSISLDFDPASLVLTKVDNINILNLVANPKVYTVSSTVTNSPTPLPSATPILGSCNSQTSSSACSGVTGCSWYACTSRCFITGTSNDVACPSPTPTSQPSNSGEGNACNGTCGSNYNCRTGYYCYFPDPARKPHEGFCRSPFCPSVDSCNCANASPTPTVVARITYIYDPAQPDKGEVVPTDTSEETTPSPRPTYNYKDFLPGELLSSPTPTESANTTKSNLNKYLMYALLIPILLIILFVYLLFKDKDKNKTEEINRPLQ